jgi:hypothetical protein
MPETPDDLNAELSALAVVVDALGPLSPGGRRRVILWLADYFEVGGADAVWPAPVDEDEIVRTAASWASAVLDMIDGKTLQQGALDSMGLGDDGDLTKTLFEGIKAAWRLAAGTEQARALWPST